MIKTYSKNNQDLKVKTQVCKKLNITEDGVSYASYEKFFFSYLYALAIKDNKIYLYGEDENKKKTKGTLEIPLSDISYAYIDKKTDLNLLLKNGKSINLTSIVGLTKSASQILKELNDSLK